MNCDVLVMAALKEELDAFLSVAGGPSTWATEPDRDGFRIHSRTLLRDSGPSLRIVLAWAGAMGRTATAERARALIDQLNPSCLAMGGICAGRRGDVLLGDVILADRVFSYDHGKLVAVTSDTGARRESFFHDIDAYNLRHTWAMDAAYDASEFAQNVRDHETRPVLLEWQCARLRRCLIDSEAGLAPPPDQLPTRDELFPSWEKAVVRLEKEAQIVIHGGTLSLTEAGRSAAQRERLLAPRGPALDPPFQVHVGPIGTGSAVQQDPEIFDRLARVERKALGVEMEVSAIGLVAERTGIPMVVAKGVSDYGDLTKDNSIRQFASRASARVVLSFLLSHHRVRGAGPVVTIDDSLTLEKTSLRPSTHVTTFQHQGNPRTLVGLAIDVSGSMRDSINNDTDGQLTRLQSFERSFERLIRDAERIATDSNGVEHTSAVRCFAYVFGVLDLQVCDLLSLIRASKDVATKAEIERLTRDCEAKVRAKYNSYAGLGDIVRQFDFGSILRQMEHVMRTRGEAEVRACVFEHLRPALKRRMQELGDVTLTLEEIAKIWKSDRTALSDSEGVLFGTTPMKRALGEMIERFRREANNANAEMARVAFVLSDGEPTDGDPLDEARALQKDGVVIVSCFLTNKDIADPRVLPTKPAQGWPPGAKLMFEVASEIDEHSKIASFLRKKRWVVARGAHYFVQINHSSVLEEFIEAVLAPGRALAVEDK
jgi:nucleoside phosphorylase